VATTQHDKKAKIDFLVAKFINKLKEAVMARKDETLHQKNADFVQDIMKKTQFSKGFNAAKSMTTRQLKKQEREKKAKSKDNMLALLGSRLADGVKGGQMNKISLLNFGNVSMPTEPAEREQETEYNKEISGIKKGMLPDDTVEAYIRDSLNAGQQPLPILNRIDDLRSEFMLLNYHLNESNAVSFSEALKGLVPGSFTKMVLVDNLLKDRHLASMFGALADNQGGGLRTITIIKNQFGDKALAQLADKYILTDAASDLRKLIIKSPHLALRRLDFGYLVQRMVKNSQNIGGLRTLTLS